MAFKPFNIEKRKPQLHSLVDMAFILLLFFLVTSVIAQLTRTEQKLSIPTPKNERGRAQILVQFIDEDRFFYLDESASTLARRIFANYGYLPMNEQIRMVINSLMNQYTMDKKTLFNQLASLTQSAQNNSRANFFIVFRCPDELPYYHVIDVMQTVSGLPNIQYGCVGGSIDDIRNAKNIRVAEEIVNGGVRQNLIIDFSG